MKEGFVARAAELAENSNLCFRHGAVVILGGKIVGEGFNYFDHHLNSRSIHAEQAALIDSFKSIKKKDLKKCTLLVVRINKSGNLCLSFPCSECHRLVRSYHLKSIVYSI